ncbi:hypothetical protein A6R70_14320 [Agrobacterium rubi]|uniref:hypothetical protein n=1 Tax=Agrobacterium rubi TaxID=28099 RepID=UPI00201B669C|nr:hypothetical protein [Agrobacterium rubi]MCL6653464.1 hypothetical protein [Agrobacterium rubi]
MKRYLWRTVGAGIFALAGLGTVNVAIWVADREPPIIYEDAKALAPTVEQGGTIEIEFSVFRTRICPLITKRWLTDSAKERHSIPQFTTGLRLLAGRETYRRSITVPVAAAPGPAEYRVTLEYRCNPLQGFLGPIVVTSPPIRFSVLPARLIPVPAI